VYKDKIDDNYFFNLKHNTNIYRYTTVDRLFQLFDKKKLVLVKPSKWDDPFENILSKVVYFDGKDNVSLRGITDKYVGQCWTKSKECDGLWRNYSKMGINKPDTGVKITTRVDKLFEYVANKKNDKFWKINTFIGNVTYAKDQEIIEFLQKINIHWIADTSGKNPAKTLFLKRNEFKYENEVRIVKSIDNASDITLNNSEVYFVDIDPFDLITSVAFSPMMENEEYLNYRNRLIKIGFDEKKISKSKLYDLFTENIIIGN
jgi:hypothetical protein